MTQEQLTDFGYENVNPAEKTRRVGEVFHRVAQKYDLMNDVMSGGIHRLWKDHLIRRMNPRPGQTLLDVAGGTGDIAFRFLQKATASNVTVCDINPAMITVGRDRALNKGITRGLEWICGTAESLPLPDNTFDFYTIAFGLRNVTDKDAALREALRVLKPGGSFFCLEFSKVQNPFLQGLYTRYSLDVIPKIGGLIAGDAASYRYLAESIDRFPTQETLAQMMREAGFAHVTHQNLTGGIAAIHKGQKA